MRSVRRRARGASARTSWPPASVGSKSSKLAAAQPARGTLPRPRGAETAPENVCDQIKYIVESEEQDRGIAGVPDGQASRRRLVGGGGAGAGSSNRIPSKQRQTTFSALKLCLRHININLPLFYT